MEDLVVDANCVVASASASARFQETANGLPRDIVASILVRLPGSDLRRLRRVCKEWRDIIVDPTFIQEFLIHGSRAPPTHTIIFFESQKGPRNGRGFLFDEQWRLTADFTPGVQDRLVGACNGLLCFLEAGQGCIKIVEPSTGESLALPLPSEASGLRWTVNPAAYCFGYDATTNGYKIMHHNYLEYVTLPLRPGEAIVDEELHVHTIGGGEGWRRLHVAFSVYGRAYADPLYVDGSVYWPTRGHGEHRREEKLVRFDLAKEKITSEATVRMRLEIPRPETAKLCRLVDSKTSCVMTYGRNCEWDAWFPKAETEQEPVFPGGLVLSTDWIVGVGGLYLRRIERGLEFGPRELLFEAGKEDPCQRAHEYNGRTSFVPVPAHRRQLRPIAGAPPRKHCQVQAFGYSPTVSAAPLALYLGMPTLPEHKSAGHVPQEQTHLLSFCNGC